MASTATGFSSADRSPVSPPSQAPRIDPAHHLAAAGAGQLGHDHDGLGRERLAQVRDDVTGDGRPELRVVRDAPLEDAEDDDDLALDLVGHPDGGRLEDRPMARGGALDLGRSDALAGDLERVVGAALDEPVAVGDRRPPSRRGPRCPGCAASRSRGSAPGRARSRASCPAAADG